MRTKVKVEEAEIECEEFEKALALTGTFVVVSMPICHLRK